MSEVGRPIRVRGRTCMDSRRARRSGCGRRVRRVQWPNEMVFCGVSFVWQGQFMVLRWRITVWVRGVLVLSRL